MQKTLTTYFLVAALFLIVFVTLFLFRTSDDNSLFSWSWVFVKVDASRIYLLLLAGLILAFSLSRTALPENSEAPFLAVLSFAACLPLWNEPEVIIDASRYFTQAKHLAIYGAGYFLKEWGRSITAWTDLPLVPFLYGMIFKLAGESRMAVQLFTTSLFSLTVVLTSLIGKRLWDRDTGFSAGLLLLGSPYLLTQVPLMLADVPAMFFFTLAVFAFLNALDRGSPAWIAFATAAVVLAALSKYSAWPMLSVLGVAALVYAFPGAGGTDRRPVWRGVGILLGATALTAAILLLMRSVVADQITLLRAYQGPGLSRWEESFRSTFLFQVHPFVTASALLSVVLAVRKRDSRYMIISWLVFLVVLFGVRRIRYTIPLFPMLSLMAGYGLQALKRDDLRRFIGYGVSSASFVIAVFGYLPFAQGMSVANLEHAGAYLRSLPAGEVEVITLPPRDPVANPAVAVPLLDMYTDKRIRYQYRPDACPPPADVGRSSLRFTWEYRNPPYYAAASSGEEIPVVVLSGAPGGPLPEPVAQRLAGYRLSASFLRSETIFRYNVGVMVYRKEPLPPGKRQ